MERFSINILRQQVYTICRLCGVDNPDKIAILSENDDIVLVNDEEEATLARKIEECVGIKVHAADQMPQNICTLCVDKVNDFYEYRLMCASTNLHTRTILNLPLVHPSISLMKSEIGAASPQQPLEEDSSDTKQPLKRGPKTRNSKKQPDEACGSEDTDAKLFPEGPTEKRLKFEFACQYCNEAYGQNTELERHLVVKHTPLIHKFGCGACMEYFETASEFKDHNLWHKLSRTTFSCFRCSRKFVKIGTLNKHIEMNTCLKGPRPSHAVQLVPDMRCTLCHKLFKTRNLYEWHGCFMRAKANCPKCGKYFMKKNLLMRHYMLYCTGTLPLLEPALPPKDEPGTMPNDSLPPDGAAPPAGTEVKRRGRPSATAARDRMKEEMIELPLSPSMMDSPDVKSETGSRPATPDASNNGGMETGGKRLKSALVEETDKIATLLRSGATVDGNSDIATINSMLSSVNEAIATISKVRKKKRKHGRGADVSGGAPDKSADAAIRPMVVLSLANVKQEALDDANIMLPGLTHIAGSAANGLNANELANEAQERAFESTPNETGDGDAEDHFAYGNDDNADSDADTEPAREEDEVINLDTSDEEGESSNVTRTVRSQAIVLPPMVPLGPVKREQHSEFESDFEGYADASEYVTVKQEPAEETNPEPVTIQSSVEARPDTSFSPYQALRIKIKKEKGWLNASMVGEEEPAAPSQAVKPAPTRKRCSTGEPKAKKAAKPPPAQSSVLAPPAMDDQPETVPFGVQIKQEPLEHHYEQQPHFAADFTPYDTSVQIKQEPEDDASTALPPPPCLTDIVAFDGTRIKSERVDNGAEKQQPASNGLVNRPAQVRKAFNPLSLTGVRLSGGKKSTTAVSQSSSSKAMINPFALLKQKSSVPTTVEGPEDGGNPAENDVNERHQERSALPVITQVKSIDPKEHTSSLPFEGTAEQPSNEDEEQQYDDASNPPVANDNSNGAGETELNSSSTLESLGNSSLSVTKTSELKIASVASIQRGTEGYGHVEPDKEAEQDTATESGVGEHISQQPSVPGGYESQEEAVEPLVQDEAEIAPAALEDVTDQAFQEDVTNANENESKNDQPSPDGDLETQSSIPIASPTHENGDPVEEVAENVPVSSQEAQHCEDEIQSPPTPPLPVTSSPTVEENPPKDDIDSGLVEEELPEIEAQKDQLFPERAEDPSPPTPPSLSVAEIPEDIPRQCKNDAPVEDADSSVVDSAPSMLDCEEEPQPSSIVASNSADETATAAPVDGEEQATHPYTNLAVNLESNSEASADVHETTSRQKEQQQTIAFTKNIDRPETEISLKPDHLNSGEGSVLQ